MNKCIITISREFGCGAREIARGLASKTNVPFYDKDLVDLTAQRAGVHVDTIKDADEVIHKKQSNLFSEFSYGSTTAFYSEKTINAQAMVIRDIANKNETCILFGRCSDYILREYSNVLNFFLYAPIDARIKHIAKTYDIYSRDAEKMIKRVDKQRHNYYKYVTGKNRGDRNGKNVMIDVDAYGVEGTIQLMYDAIKIRFEEK